MAPFNISYELLVTRLKNFQLETNKAFNFTASPSQPQYFLYKFPEDVDSVIIKVVSDAVYPCSVVSVQDIVCPVYDLDHNVEFNGVYQSMTKQAAITVQRKDFPGEQFFVVFVIKPEDYACGGSVPSSIRGNVNRTWNLQRTKNLQVTIVPSIKKSVYVQAMFFSFLSFLSFYLGSVVVAFVHYIRVQRKAAAGRLSPEDGSGMMTSSHPITASTPEGSSYGAIDESSSSGGQQLSTPERGPPAGSDTDSSVEEESDFDTMPEIESDKNVIRTKVFLYLSDLSRKDRRIVSKKYKIYFWNIITIAVFYALPVIQLVITYQTEAGVQLFSCSSDVSFGACFNFRDRKNLLLSQRQLKASSECDRQSGHLLLQLPVRPPPWGPECLQQHPQQRGPHTAGLSFPPHCAAQGHPPPSGHGDEGYLYSVCPCCCGDPPWAYGDKEMSRRTILVAVAFPSALTGEDLGQQECPEMLLFRDYGIPKHFGLFYAMGIALMMEGVLSACYHVCPNYSNFQFDTSFMYMIAGLCMLKLYQTRHPDINASAYSAYASFAVVICLAVLGVVFGKNDVWFWVIFSLIHVLASLALSTQIYYMGRFKIDLGIFRRAAMVLYTDCIQQCSRPMYMVSVGLRWSSLIPTLRPPLISGLVNKNIGAKDRMVLLIVGNLVNWSFAIFGLVYRPRDFASYILGIFICNLLLYLAFYIIMKLRSSEKLLPIPLFCIMATAVVWAAALYFFFQTLSSWEETPAESREKNRPCILMGFFDDHDVWHFLSAAALFFSFLVLLTLDDDLDTVRRDKIPVF
ncbi:SID1 transmembrane family member 1 isoform X3 [Apus apus]|uniref:SID1 transmembrane family member 1 isoform X3 n=1 Tax=Apus apus TaxID=8895 RepID=UPI0021F838B9|nr:SID1 transmembrane family member 1 isoform X3 [Apus apus]